MRERNDRAAGPEPRDGTRGAAGEGRDEDRLRLQRLREVAGRVRHRLPDRRVLVRLGQLVPVVDARLDGQRDPVHVGDRLDRVLPDGGLTRKHHGRGAVEDCVRHVARLGPRRLGRVDLRLEHLGRRDHGLPAFEGLVDDPLLHERDERGPDLHPEIPPRDHHRVGLGQDVVEDVDRLGLLDLRDHVRVRAGLDEQGAQVAHVRRRADEGERDEVHARLERPVEVRHVLPRQRRDRDGHTGKVDALVRADEAAGDDRAACASSRHLVDAKPDEPVVDQYLVAPREDVPDHRRCDRQLAVRRRLLGADGDAVALVEDDRLRQLPDAELRPLQVGDEGDRAAGLGRDLPYEPGARGVLLVGAVREVEAHGVDAGLDERAQPLPRVRRRPEGCDDLGPAFCRHTTQGTSGSGGGTPPSRGTWRGHQAPPRSARAGCTSRSGRSGSPSRS